MYDDDEIRKYIEPLYEKRTDEEDFTRAYINNMYKFYGYGIWIICRKDNDEIIGRVGLENREIDGRVMLEAGYIISRDYRRLGYGTEIMQGIMKFATEVLEEKELICVIEKDNEPSMKFAESLGFEFKCEISSDDENGYQTFNFYEIDL